MYGLVVARYNRAMVVSETTDLDEDESLLL